MPRVEDRYLHPFPDATDVTIQMSSPFCWCPIVVSNRQMHKYLCVALFVDYKIALISRFDSKLDEVGKPLVQQLTRNLR